MSPNRARDYADALGPVGAHDRPLTSPPDPARPAPRYGRYSVHLTDDLHAWARRAAVQAAEELGTSAAVTSSEVVRAALRHLRAAVDAGEVQLGEALTAQAHEEARDYPGRKTRGMPRLA